MTEYYTMYLYNNHIQAKKQKQTKNKQTKNKYQKNFTVSKWQPDNRF